MKYLKWLLKCSVTVLLLWWVFHRTDVNTLQKTINRTDKVLLALAFLPYLASRATAAVRLTSILHAHAIPISQTRGLYLHWISNFYGMFLPGGLGGDAYKLLRLNQHFPEQGSMLLTRILLWDRLLGLAMLGLLAVIAAAIRFHDQPWIACIPLATLPAAWLLWRSAKKWMPAILSIARRVLLLSIATQLSQLACIAVLLNAVGITRQLADYALLFLVSSIATVVPVSVGGIGVRELVFLRGSTLLGVSEHVAVGVSFLFDLIVSATAISGGALLIVQKPGAPASKV